MNLILEDIRQLLGRELRTMASEIELFPDDASVWLAPVGITNPAGTLALHGCGNLQHYIGAVLGKTGYMRDRDAEFNDRSASRASIIAEIDETIHVLDTVLPGLSSPVLDEPFAQPVGGVILNTRLFLLHLCSHLAFHVGQVGYLRRILTGSETSSGGVSIKEIDL